MIYYHFYYHITVLCIIAGRLSFNTFFLSLSLSLGEHFYGHIDILSIHSIIAYSYISFAHGKVFLKLK